MKYSLLNLRFEIYTLNIIYHGMNIYENNQDVYIKATNFNFLHTSWLEIFITTAQI